MTPEEKAAYNKSYRERNRSRLRELSRDYYYAHHEKKKAEHRAWGKAHSKERAEYLRSWNKLNPEKKKEYSQNRLKKYPQYARAKSLKRKYGITIEEFNERLSSQGGVCSICKMAEWGAHGPVVDHDHSSGAVRGILCHRCNSAIGMILESVETAKSIIRYLKGETND